MQTRRNKIIKSNSILFICGVIYYFLIKYTSFSISCLFNDLTGLKCPGCGITKCILSLLKLDIKKAFYYNQLVVVLLPIFIILYFYNCYKYVKYGNTLKIDKKYSISLLIVVLLFGIIRNF